MRLKDYRSGLLERLKDSSYAVQYLTEVLRNESNEAFLIALKDVVDARGENISQLAKKAGVTRQSLYHLLSRKGNPTLGTLVPLLRNLGFNITISTD